MDLTGKPDIGSIDEAECKASPFPIAPEFRITMSELAYGAMHSHAGENDSIELCGVLVGSLCRDEQGPFLHIVDTIRGEHAHNSGTQVTFTHDTWSYINDRKDSRFPDLRIVGWYHTHPRFGVFLSEQDQFIHKHFFNQPWQVAFVIDQVQGDEGFFIWKNGVPVLLKEFWIEGKRIGRALGQHRSLRDSQPTSVMVPKRSRGKLLLFAGGIIIVFLISLGTLVYLMGGGIPQRTAETERASITSISATTPLMAEDRVLLPLRDTIQRRVINDPMLAGNHVRLEVFQGRLLCYGSVTSTYQKARITSLISTACGTFPTDLNGLTVTHWYRTVKGDNLYTLAGRFYGDHKLWEEIFNANRRCLTNPDSLVMDFNLYLP
jgi:proteasome lid subunit RPN8/RPN11